MYFAATGQYEDQQEPPDEVEPFGWRIGIKNHRRASQAFGDKEERIRL